MTASRETVQRLLEEGVQLQVQGRYGEAAGRFERAVALDSSDLGARALFAHALVRANRLNRARREFQRLVASTPDNAGLRTNLGAVLQQQGRLPEAIEEFRRAISSDPALAEAHTGLGIALLRAGDSAEARLALMRAASLQPGNAIALAAAGDACRDLARHDDAIDWYRRALAIEPSMVEARTNLGQMLLLQGRFPEGWAELERARAPAEQERAAHHAKPRWRGEDLVGRSILVWFLQGIGDQVMYAGCLDELSARGARCEISCDPRLSALFKRSWPDATVLPPGNVISQADFQIAAEALPRLLRRSAEAFPRHSGYLTPDPQWRRDARHRLAALGPGLKVGLSWRGGTARTRRSQRTIPLGALAGLAATPGTRFVSLQYDETGTPWGEPEDPPAAGIAHWPEITGDPDRTSSLIAELDLVVSVPTTVIHLAGALGKPTWILTPHTPDWRYLSAGETMPWYPAARLLRQQVSGDWSTPIALACARLASLAGELRTQS